MNEILELSWKELLSFLALLDGNTPMFVHKFDWIF